MSGGPTTPAQDEPGTIKDFDVLAPPKRLAKIGGEEVDISFIPTRIALEFMAFSDFKEEGFKPEMFQKIVDVTAKLCLRSNPKMTADWILDNVDPVTLMQFLVYSVKSLTEGMKDRNVDIPGAEGAGGEAGETKN